MPELRMPAEWLPQSAIWLSWPHNTETWPENLFEAQQEFIALAQLIAQSQAVKILCPSRLVSQVSNSNNVADLNTIANVELVDVETNDAWARDYAPTFVKESSGNLVAINWHYNAWGGKYPPFDSDQAVAKKVAERLKIELVSPDLCFEGGAVEISESGILLTTKSCALDTNRNAEVSIDQVESILRQTLGCREVVWLSGDAIDGDDTDGHIDQLARFTDDQTIVYAWDDSGGAGESGTQYSNLVQNLTDLKAGLERIGFNVLEDVDPDPESGDGIRLLPLPVPDPIHSCGRRIPASYCNFLIANEVVVVPQFGDQKSDERALAILKPLFPNREVVGLSSINLSVGLGSFHCLSQQQPA